MARHAILHVPKTLTFGRNILLICEDTLLMSLLKKKLLCKVFSETPNIDVN